MKTKFQAAINAIKANKAAIVRKSTIAVGVGAGMILASALVDKIRTNSDEPVTSETNSFNASTENPYNSN